MPKIEKTEEDRKYDEFVRDIATVINRHSWERFSNTPDFVLAEYMVGCLTVFENTLDNRMRLASPVRTPTPTPHK